MTQPIFGYNSFEKINGTNLLDNQIIRMDLPSELSWLQLGDPCWYCGTQMINHGFTDSNNGSFLKQNITVCGKCGWWMIKNEELENAESYPPKKVETYFSKLYTFELSDKDVDLNLLSTALAIDWQRIKKVHPKKFEEFAAAIISDLYKCEVILTGYSKDNGIDFYSVICDEPWAFQVKRRSTNSNEGIEEIKEFIGSMIINDVPRGIFITSAPRFTKGAQKLLQSDNLNRYNLKLELINGEDIKSYFKLYYSSKNAIWRDLYHGDSQDIIDVINEMNLFKE